MELKTLDISFCDKNALNLVNKEAKELIINEKLSEKIQRLFQRTSSSTSVAAGAAASAGRRL